ncbi:MAG: geranylgeranylglyceryl/heptaprenylglyceryl phosphate synthase [Flavobacteriaceae bacterium]|nr:geranylgeranylglyceryl/heptaprenylglyceryl phosphate synthase [Flavobacteriaceae bacterium]
MENRYYQDILKAITEEKKLLAILIDPDKFDTSFTESFFKKIPKETTHLFVGGSTVEFGTIEKTVQALKKFIELPVFLFPGDYAQVTPEAEAILFLSLISGRNPEYLIGQQTKAVPFLKDLDLEIIPTGYILIDGGNESAVARVSETKAMPQSNIENIVNTALAGEYLGAKFIYLEAGSGAKMPVNYSIIEAVKNAISIPLIVGGGIKTEEQKQKAYSFGADLVVMGTAFEN